MRDTTWHEYAKRVSETVLKKQVDCIKDNAVIKQIFNAVNIYLLVINDNRQILYANNNFLNALGILENYIVGKRPGEAIRCIHCDSQESGCGTAEACRCCNALNIVLQSIKSGQAQSGEIAISCRNNSFEFPMNMFENVTPIQICSETYYIVSLIDISDMQRRRMLERLFFHDIINTTGALQGLIGLLKDEVPDSIKTDIVFVEAAFNGVVDEIIEQKQILDAENGEILVERITFRTNEIIEMIVKLYQSHDIAVGKSIIISEDTEQHELKSDYVLIKRVLGNMVKNACESTRESQTIKIGSRKLLLEDWYIEFWVWNREYIPRDVQNQIFQRSFSTKAKNRGIGTYAMKLLGERYLKGKVGFESTQETGTFFYIRVPETVPGTKQITNNSNNKS